MKAKVNTMKGVRWGGRRDERSAGGDGGFYLSDLHFCCTDAALFRPIIIMPLSTSAGREETGNNSAAHSLVSFFYNYTLYTQQLGNEMATKWR